MLKIVTLNVRHGGGSRIHRVVQTVASLSPDVFVATEYRNGPVGTSFRIALDKVGLSHQVAAPTPERSNSVLVAARHPLALDDRILPKKGWLQDRHLIVRIGDFTLAAVYLPPGTRKIPSWKRIIESAKALATEPTALIGDFNTGKHHIDEEGATFIAPEYLDRLEALGYVDAWRRLNPRGREYTWYSPGGNGFRLDHAFISPVLAPALSDARHIDATRIDAVTDHSALLVEFKNSIST